MAKIPEQVPLGELIRTHERVRALPERAAECPEASVLAAYVDRTLGASEAAGWEAHFAGCAGCREELAALVRIGEADATSSSPPWWNARRWTSGVAIAAVAAAAVIVIVSETGSRKHPETIAMTERGLVAAESPRSNTPSRQESARADFEHEERLRAQQAEGKSSAVSQPAANSAERASSTFGGELQKKEEPTNQAAMQNRNPEATAANASTTQTLAAPGSAGRASAGSSRQAARAEAEYAAAAPAIHGEIKSAGPAQNPAVRAGLPGASAIAVEPPDHSVVWMIGAHGAISRYTPGGGWSAQRSNVRSDLTGGSAVSRSVCWLVGRDGTVLRSVDGEHWTKIAAPSDADLVAVISSSSNNATITTADRRQYTTSDGGKTWRLK